MPEQKPISPPVQRPPEAAGRQSRPKPGPIWNEQARAIRNVFLSLVIVAALALLMVMLLYLQTRTWQLLGVVACLGMGLVIAGISYTLLRRGKVTEAGYLILLPILIAFAGNELFVKSETTYIALSGALLTFVAASIVLPRRWWMWLGTSGLLLLAVWLVNRLAPWPRMEASQIPALRLFVPLLATGALLATVALAYRAYRRIATIRVRLLVTLVITVGFTAFVVGLTSTTISLRSGQQQVARQLESVATLKEAEITLWAQELQRDLAAIIGEEYFPERVASLIGPVMPYANVRQRAHDRLLERLQQAVARTGRYESIDLLDTTGTVILSTEERQEGKNFSTQPYFYYGVSGPYLQPPTYFPSLGRTVVIVSRPIVDSQGHTLGVLAGRANLSALNEIMSERAGLGATGRTYLVGANNALLTGQPEDRQITYVHSPGIEAVLSTRTSYRGVDNDYRNIPVIGEYRWLPALQVLLVAEQEQAEAFAPIMAVRALGIGVALLAAALAALISYFVAQTIANPLAELADTATRIAEGDLARVARVVREDEVGTLARAFNRMTTQLRELIAGLEQRVAERTADLQQRTIQLQAAAQVARDAAEIRDVGTLLDTTVRLISERFGFYHAGIFLLDDAREYAVLRAASSEGGQRMLTRGHKLRVGQVGIVGYTAATAKPRIALDVGADAVFFDNPDLPDTRSEMALPLKVRDQVIGVLDVQSTQEAAFTEADIAILQTLADQLGLAIENARLLEASRQALQELQALYGQQVRQAWQERTARQALAFRYTRTGVEPARGDGQPSLDDTGYRLTVPILLREETLGTIVLQRDPDAEPWQPEEIALAREVSTQIGLALENARLLEETRRHAQRDRLIAEITSRVRASMDPETILRTAVRELGIALGTERTFVQLSRAPAASPSGAANEE